MPNVLSIVADNSQIYPCSIEPNFKKYVIRCTRSSSTSLALTNLAIKSDNNACFLGPLTVDGLYQVVNPRNDSIKW